MKVLPDPTNPTTALSPVVVPVPALSTHLPVDPDLSLRAASLLHEKKIASSLQLHQRLKPTEPDQPWWKSAVIYQIYIPSFKDTNGDGYGDLRGVTAQLDYLVKLGVDCLWLSPIFESPMYDMGYDISDYYAINHRFGTMQDFERLLALAHAKGLRVILDVAFNHTSDEHAWFKRSIAAQKVSGSKSSSNPDSPSERASRDAENDDDDEDVKDFYIWGSPKHSPSKENNKPQPPSNWASVFGGSMWKYLPEIDKYYLHIFGDKQPDLNWESPKLRQAVYKVMRFWLDKGVDGFRLDAINCISKVPGWPDVPIVWRDKEEQKCNEMFANGPNVHKYLHEMYIEVFSHYPHALTLGEMSCGITTDIAPDFVSRDPAQRQLDLMLHFGHIELDCYDGDKWLLRDWTLPELKRVTTAWQDRMDETGRWDTLWIENHDQPRAVTRFCRTGREHRETCAKLLAIWECSLQGTVIVYNGQELGMVNPEKFSEDMIRDVETRYFWDKAQESPENLDQVKKAIVAKSRDVSRLPIPWTHKSGTSGGFTQFGAEPWIPCHPAFKVLCAEDQTENLGSVWSFYRGMLRLRKSLPALIYGKYRILDPDHPDIFAYTRTYGKTTYLVTLNFSAEEIRWKIPDGIGERWLLVVSNYSDDDEPTRSASRSIKLRPYEGTIWGRLVHKSQKSADGVGLDWF